ncbi:MAG: hypothetical protein ACKOGA_16105 [Planctomycetaceae bacterium]
MWAVLSFVGCGSKPAGESAASVEEGTGGEGGAEAASPDQSAPTGSRKTAGKKTTSKRKGPGIGEIPRDAWPEIFFDNPSAVAAETGAAVVAGGATTGTPDMAGPAGKPADKPAHETAGTPATAPPTNDPAPPATETPAGGAWAALLPTEAFADEAKSLRAALNSKLQSVGQYNGAYRDVQVDAAVLAALAQMADEYPEAPSWKKHAPLVRDTAAEVCREAGSVGDKFFKPTREAFDKLDSLLSGSVPPGLGESPAKMTYQAFAPRLALMKRLDRSHSWLKSNVNTADLLKKESDRVIREAGVLGALSQVILTGGYDDSDDEKYQELVANVRDGAKGVVMAAQEADFDAYQKSLDAIYKGCTTCHSEFKNN